MPPKVLLIALDGATFDVIRPLMAAGRLPTFSRLVAEGASGDLQSTYPVITPPAFASMLTGCNPGKHGVYDFFSRLPNSYDFAPSNGATIRVESLHRIAARHGLRSGSMNMPMTFPPADVANGFVVAGLETPPGADYTFPRDLQRELESRFDYRIELDRWYRTGAEQAEMDAILALADTHRRAALHLLEAQQPDVFAVALRAPDHAQHYFWRFYDPKHPAWNAADASRCGDYIPQSYEACDRAIADLIDAAGPDATVVVTSDHGFGSETKMVHLNNWLEREGFLRFKGGVLGRIKKATFRLGLTADNVVNLLARLRLERLFTGVSRTTKAGIFSRFFLSYDDIDWSRTQAYARGQIGQIFLNVRGREPHGIIAPGDEYRAVRARIIERLGRLRDPDTKGTIVERCHVREDLYDGPSADAAPDIVIDWKNMEYWAFDVISGGRKIIGPNLATRSGGHRMNGIFLARGPGIAAGVNVDGANIIDVAPTMLQLLDLPVPTHMDGRVLAEIFRERPSEPTREFVPAAVPAADDDPYSPEDEQAVKERLRQLGYI
ncbi:MAG TPA: alkaline phosphatase family protein [Dehalococcoidia bacterium]